MINSRIFNNVCHLDTIFRYINSNDIIPTTDCDCSEERVLKLGRACIKNNIKIEYNLSGTNHPVQRSFPSRSVIIQLIKEGAKIFIGSDSHHIDYFKSIIPLLKKEYKFLSIND